MHCLPIVHCAFGVGSAKSLTHWLVDASSGSAHDLESVAARERVRRWRRRSEVQSLTKFVWWCELSESDLAEMGV